MPDLLRALVFLDYDGVIQTPKRSNWRDFEYLPAFEAVLRDFPEVGVVLTTTHRFGRTLDTLRRPYSEDIRHRIIGGTPDLICGDADGGRYEEILQWLKDGRMQHLPWIALDDVARLYPKECPQLLRCNPYAGFDEFLEEEFRARLNIMVRGNRA
jgi:hypothetical protein